MRRDVRVIQRGEDLASRWKRASRSAIARERLGQDLDRDVAIQLRVAGPIDLAHSAFANAGR